MFLFYFLIYETKSNIETGGVFPEIGNRKDGIEHDANMSVRIKVCNLRIKRKKTAEKQLQDVLQVGRHPVI